MSLCADKQGQALRVAVGWGSQISWQPAHECCKFVNHTHRLLLPPGNIRDTHFCYRLSRPQSHGTAGRIMSMGNSNYTIGNRTREIPECSAVSQPTALLRDTFLGWVLYTHNEPTVDTGKSTSTYNNHSHLKLYFPAKSVSCADRRMGIGDVDCCGADNTTPSATTHKTAIWKTNTLLLLLLLSPLWK